MIAGLMFAFAQIALSQTTTFTYQGRLTDGVNPASGSYLLQLKLYDGAGTQIGSTISDVAVTAAGGIFTAQLDFGPTAFPGADRFIEIAVKKTAGDPYTTLTPRQPITSTPYSIRSLSAATADSAATATTATNAAQLGGTAANQFVQTNSTAFVRNQTTTQAATDFNISGTGAANVFNAGTQFNIGSIRILSNPGTNNLFAGINAGVVNTGQSNSFFGFSAGVSNQAGNNNSFFGRDAGNANINGIENTFVGVNAGFRNTSGGDNTFVGVQAGNSNTVGNFNTIIGTSANVGANNLTFATAIGSGATVSTNNAVVLGRSADTVQIPGNLNVAGTFTGNVSVAAGNVTGVLNTAQIPNLGASYIANQTTAQTGNFNITGDGTVGGMMSANSVTSATQYNLGTSRILGSFGTDNTVVGLAAGRITTGTDNSFFGTGSGFFNLGGSFNSFFGESSGFNNSSGANNSFFGASAGGGNTSGAGNSFFGSGAGGSNQGGSNNVFLGNGAGTVNVSGSNNTIIGANANFPGGANNLTYATLIGAGASGFESNTIVLGRNEAFDTVRIPGKLKIQSFGTGGLSNVCLNTNLEVAFCSSSLRYKTNIAPFNSGLNLVNRLRPISFDWKDGGMHDVGFGAEDVAAINPLFVNYNTKGEVEGVKYDRLSVVFVNAFKEQQAQVEAQQKQIDEQKALIGELKKLVCANNPTAGVCK